MSRFKMRVFIAQRDLFRIDAQLNQSLYRRPHTCTREWLRVYPTRYTQINSSIISYKYHIVSLHVDDAQPGNPNKTHKMAMDGIT
ncbi:hypothetical protein L208DRAFT_355336 [Tricholoma matsutake]|nr:hypothetical protein L208DRAFT_355336 [Tricholoma matsutake 945]